MHVSSDSPRGICQGFFVPGWGGGGGIQGLFQNQWLGEFTTFLSYVWLPCGDHGNIFW